MTELDEETTRLAEQIREACLREATARKPGNVHPEARFDDLCYEDFIRSAEASCEWLAQSRTLGVGQAVLKAIEATRRRVTSNTNLGIVLLIAPLAAVPSDVTLSDGIEAVLKRLTVADTTAVFQAIRLTMPGGIGEIETEDVRSEPTLPLREAMRLAVDRDRIARQYVTGFEDVLGFGLSTLRHWRDVARRGNGDDPDNTAVVGLHLSMMAAWPDSLIVRKCGPDVAELARLGAADVLRQNWPLTTASHRSLAELDRWLRADGNRRNPGTTADLIAATLFAELRESSRGDDSAAPSPFNDQPNE